jgi:hypothetical protein
MATINLIRQFQFNHMTLSRLLADVSHDESLKEIGSDGKCINWIVGHVIAARGKLLMVLGFEPAWYKDQMAVYGGGEAGKFSVETAKPLSELQRLHDQTLNVLSETLANIGSALNDPCNALPHVSEGGTVADRVGAFACHEAYHVGQIGLLRRMLGKPGLF